jgi:ABC-type multidrug transport system ATPase subunit
MSRGQEQQFRRHLGVVFHLPALISNLTLAENLLLPLDHHYPQREKKLKRQQVEHICAEFALEDYLDMRTDQLSRGLASIAAFARALLIEPQCLVWNAPLNDIDIDWCKHITKRLEQLKQAGTTLVLFTNRQPLIDEFADIHVDLSADACHRTQVGRTDGD